MQLGRETSPVRFLQVAEVRLTVLPLVAEAVRLILKMVLKVKVMVMAERLWAFSVSVSILERFAIEEGVVF